MGQIRVIVYWRTGLKGFSGLVLWTLDTYDTAIITLEKWNIVSPLGFRNQEDHQHMPRSTSNAHPGDSVTLILSASWIRFIRL